MELKDFIIMFLVLGIVTTGLGYILGGFTQAYGNNLNVTHFNETFNKISEAESLANQTREDALDSGSIDEPVGFYSFSKKVWQAVKGLMAAPNLLKGILDGTLDSMGLGWVSNYILVIVGVTLLFMLIYMFWRWRG